MQIRDQRSMIGASVLVSVNDVEATWAAYAAQNGFPSELRGLEPGTRIFELRELDEAMPARVELGRWLADCPSIDCHGGAAAWPKNPKACCLDCGTVFPVSFPPASEIAKAELVLAARPLTNQGWNTADESVDDLKAENVVRGLPMQLADLSPGSRATREEAIRAAAARSS